MKLYALLVLGLAAMLTGDIALMDRLHKFRFEPQQARQGPVVDQLLGTAMPADAMDLQHVVDDLRELRQDPALQSIGKYQAYQVLSRALGATPDSVATVKDTISWARDFPDRTEKARQEAMATALSVRLAAPATTPPKAGRSGFNWNRDFSDEGGGVWTLESSQKKGTRLPLYYFVVEVRNHLRVPLKGFDFFLVVGDAAAQRLELPPRSYIVCDNSNYAGSESLLAPGADRQMLCELRLAPEPAFSPGDFAKLLQRARSGELHFATWTKELSLEVPGNHSLDGLQLRDRGVDAEHLHGPSMKIESSFVQSRAPDANPKGSLLVRTTCEQRGDCAETRMKKLSLFAGFFQDALVVLGGMLPGAVVAGLVIALARTRASRKGALTALGFLSPAAFPVAMKMGGSGWGPVVAVLILAYAEAGFWAGVLLGWIALKPVAAKD